MNAASWTELHPLQQPVRPDNRVRSRLVQLATAFMWKIWMPMTSFSQQVIDCLVVSQMKTRALANTASLLLASLVLSVTALHDKTAGKQPV
jgi:hypothetical protein